MNTALLTAAGWIVLGVPAAVTTTVVGGRLLGVRRGWTSLAIAGTAGSTVGVLAAGALTGWGWRPHMMVLGVLVGVVATMTIALGLDLVAPVGSLARGDAAGLVVVARPLRRLQRTMAPLQRYQEVLAIARANGVVGRGVDAAERPAAVRRTLEELGGIFVKLGQIASTRADVLPPAWCAELATLRTATAAVPQEEMRRHLAAELGADPSAVFATFDWTPIASASISQVYAATLHEGTAVVVKVQCPGLDAAVERDGAAVMQLARLVERRTPLGMSLQPAEFACEVLDSVHDELDFRIEAATPALVAESLAGRPGVRVPVVHTALSGRRVLVEERIVGRDLGGLDERADGSLDRGQLADRLVELFVHQLFGVGVFHADPHPGNLLLAQDGSIALIDLGAVGRLSDVHRSVVLEMVVAASTADAVALREALARIAPFDRRADLTALDTELDAFLTRHIRRSGTIGVAAFEDVTVLVARHGIHLPRWFATLTRAMVTLEGTVKGLDPTFSFVESATRHSTSTVRSSLAGDGRNVVAQTLVAEAARLRRLPAQLDDALGQLVGGRLSAQISLLSDERDVRLVTRLAGRFVLAMIAAATLITSVLLLGIDDDHASGAAVTVNELLGYVGLGAAAVLALRVVAGVIRDGEA